MENYDILLNEIKEYLNKEEVSNYETNNKVISLYDLYSAINSELEGLVNITQNSKIYKKINGIRSFFSEKDYFVVLSGDENKSQIEFQEKHDDNNFTIYKDRNINEVYFSDSKNCSNKHLFNFVKSNYNLILKTLSILEDYIDLLGKINTYTCDKYMYFEDDLFRVCLSYNKFGIVNVDIKLCNNHKLYDEYSKNWYKRENICDFAKKNQDEILKRILVSPHTLNEDFKKIYNKTLERTKQPQKVKTLRKMSNL